MEIKGRDVTVAALGVAAAVGGAYAALKWQQNRHEQPPPDEQWRQVGTLKDLFCFPIKSCGVVRVDSMHCSKLGLSKGIIRDRIFAIVDSEKHFQSGRTHPKMILIQPKFEGDFLVLSAPGMDDIKIKIPVEENSSGNVTVQGHILPSVDCGEEVAEWLSKYMEKPGGCRLVYYPDKISRREVRGPYYPAMKKEDLGAYGDLMSFCLINEASVQDLNGRLAARGVDPVEPLVFRGNLVVGSNEPYVEDNWNWVKIGDAIFRGVAPCTRCIMTTLNYENGTRNKDQQPLKTLKEYRSIHEASPTMGRYLAVRKEANISVGDPVFVA